MALLLQYLIFCSWEKFKVIFHNNVIFIRRNLSTAYAECNVHTLFILFCFEPGDVAQSVAPLTQEPEVPSLIPGPATYFRFSFS